MVIELKTIPTNKIMANPEQPRETFEREKLRELADSIKEIGLINPITVRKKGKQFEIVSGERRWRAHQIAKIKNVPALIKEYTSEGQVAVESLIENVHREDLKEIEKARFLKRIKDMQKIDGRTLAKMVGFSHTYTTHLLALCTPGVQHISKSVASGEISEHHFRAITSLKDKETEKKLLKKVKAEDLSTTKTDKLASVVKKSTPEVKDALLDDKITVDQAERISKLKSLKEREIAIKQHQDISKVQDSVERVVEQQMSAVEKRKQEKDLVQTKNWIASLKGKVVDSKKEIEKTLTVLMISTKFIPVMDDDQKQKLDEVLDRFIEILDKGKQISEQIQEKL